MQHNTSYGGNCQSLGFISERNGILVGVINPGKYQMGKIQFGETITVITGKILINGEECAEGKKIGLKKGTDLFLETRIISSYLRVTEKRK